MAEIEPATMGASERLVEKYPDVSDENTPGKNLRVAKKIVNHNNKKRDLYGTNKEFHCPNQKLWNQKLE